MRVSTLPESSFHVLSWQTACLVAVGVGGGGGGVVCVAATLAMLAAAALAEAALTLFCKANIEPLYSIASTDATDTTDITDSTDSMDALAIDDEAAAEARAAVSMVFGALYVEVSGTVVV
jgi:hypothetical protein